MAQVLRVFNGPRPLYSFGGEHGRPNAASDDASLSSSLSLFIFHCQVPLGSS